LTKAFAQKSNPTGTSKVLSTLPGFLYK